VPASLCDVLPAAAALIGAARSTDDLRLVHALGVRRRVIVVVVDGMGLRLLERMRPHAPLIASVLDGQVGRLTPMSCTFPSTTPTSLVSLGTGTNPGQHGVLGFTVLVPGSDRVLTHIAWGDEPDPETWQPAPTWFERLAAAGVATGVVLPAPFRGSGLTRAAYRGADFHGLARDEDAAHRILSVLPDDRGLVYGYTAALDTAAHLYGIASAQWSAAAAQVDGLLTRITERLPADTALLVTADHGGLDVPADGRIDLDADPALSAGLRAVAGEPRVRYLHTVPGASADVEAVWREVLGDRADVLTRDAAVDSGLFGPVTEAHRERIGDLVVICRGETVVLATGHEPPEVSKLVGFHGALTPAETEIPLIAIGG